MALMQRAIDGLQLIDALKTSADQLKLQLVAHGTESLRPRPPSAGGAVTAACRGSTARFVLGPGND